VGNIFKGPVNPTDSMDKQSRAWFDSVYRYCSGKFPIRFLIGEFEHVDLVRATSGRYTEDEYRQIEAMAGFYHQHLPPEEAFYEEKKIVLPNLAKDLYNYLPMAGTAVHFGKVVGDIDIGLICDELDSEELEGMLVENKALVKAYPLVDWDSLPYLLSGSPGEFVQKIVHSRQVSRDMPQLPEEEVAYIKETLLGTKLLWGSEECVDTIRSSAGNMAYLSVSSRN
jgi:hypothetical protein